MFAEEVQMISSFKRKKFTKILFVGRNECSVDDSLTIAKPISRTTIFEGISKPFIQTTMSEILRL